MRVQLEPVLNKTMFSLNVKQTSNSPRYPLLDVIKAPVLLPLPYPLCHPLCGLQQCSVSAGCSCPARTGILGPPGPSAAGPKQSLADCDILQGARGAWHNTWQNLKYTVSTWNLNVKRFSYLQPGTQKQFWTSFNCGKLNCSWLYKSGFFRAGLKLCNVGLGLGLSASIV